MKRINLLTLAGVALLSLTLLTSCGGGGGSNGQLTGAMNRPTWRTEIPYGMVAVPTGTFVKGGSDQDVQFDLTTRPKQVTIGGFYMDDTEITNNEYRQFVQDIVDSIAHTLLGHFKSENGGDEVSVTGNPPIDWKQKIDMRSPETQSTLAPMYLPQDQWINGYKELDVAKLVYKYEYTKLKSAAYAVQNKIRDRKKHVVVKSIPIYPDTLCWVRDFTYSYNEPFARNYYSHPAFDDYPAVGITWDQANAFGYWRTEKWNQYRVSRGRPKVEDIRLPTEDEWEYAARGGFKNAQYPWGGPYTRNQKGCLLANFKPTRGNYQEDGGFKTVKADSYFPNNYGLYNMAGNVSEWTITHFSENARTFTHDHNPDIKYDHTKMDSETMKRKVIRGGSWKDVAMYIQCGVPLFEYADSSKSYVGFRCVSSMLK